MKIIFFGDSLTEGVPGVSFFKILEKKLPKQDLINEGKSGDTVISLFRRVRKMKLEKYDIAFIMVGVNDILVHTSLKYPIVKTINFQPWTREISEFKWYYQNLLDIITNYSKKVYTVSPTIIGEDIFSRWNTKLEELSNIIQKITRGYKKAEFLNLRIEMIDFLREKKTSEFIMNSLIRDGLIAYIQDDFETIEKTSQKRGLFLTFDGVHLNNKGANIVAECFYKNIKKGLNKIK